MRKATALLLLVAILFTLAACYTHVHTVGKGPQGRGSMEARQWYFLWGLMPLNNVDTAQMAAGAMDYEIKTEQAPLDIIIGMFTSTVTIYSRTVTVTK